MAPSAEKYGANVVELCYGEHRSVGFHTGYHIRCKRRHIGICVGRSIAQERLNVDARGAHRLESAEVGFSYAQRTGIVGSEGPRGSKHIVELHVLGERTNVAVDIQGVVDYLDAIAGKAYGALYEILSAVDRAVYHIAERGLVGLDLVAAVLLHEQVVVHRCFLELGSHSVAGWEIEHNDVALLYRAQPFEAAVLYRRFVEVRLMP